MEFALKLLIGVVIGCAIGYKEIKILIDKLNLLSWYEKIAWFFIELLALWKLYKFEFFIVW